ncbi:MAG: two-component regulator propeller domain-containing protein, partial [Candidatus Thalassarchaeaceae archaeon]|nr:two-component regulator propeller domain-containing protein [Candidatus Thalassarchaeaceae archaeon]
MVLGLLRLRPFVLVGLMLLASLSPLMQMDAGAHPSYISEWGSGGYNDTGWLRIDAVGADPSSGQMAEGDLHLELAPGAMIENLSFEVRVNGSNGTWIEQPQLSFVDTQTSIMDWRGLGGFGQQNNLMGSDPHSSRLSPNSEAGASWLIPGDAEVTDLVVEALRPADAYVTLSPIEVNVNATAIHPTDGRLYMLMGQTLIQLDAANDPPVIEIADDIFGAKTMVVDENNDRLLVAVDDNGTKFRAWSLSDSNEIQGPLALDSMLPSGQFATAMYVDISGVLWIGTNKADLIAVNPSGFQITVLLNPLGGSDHVTDIVEISGEVLLATNGGGVMRFDSLNNQWLTSWDSQNSLPSDNVAQFSVINGILMIALADAGIVRYNIATTSWLATWTDANWLDSNNVHGMEIGGEWLHILAGDSLHFYNITMGAFSSSKSLQNVGLVRGGMDLISWPSGGTRAPAVDLILAGDGSGSFAQLEPATPPIHSSTLLLASGPSSLLMYDVLEINDMVWVAGDEVIDIFDKQHNRWLNPIWTGTMNQALETDGNHVWLATKDAGIFKYALNGSIVAHLQVGDGLNSNDADYMAYDGPTDTLVVGHSAAGVTLVNNTNDSVSSSWSSGRSDQFSNNVRDVAARAAIAYIASNKGVLRIDITNDTLLSSWSSTGMDDVLYMPVETDGNLIYLGMYGYGVLVFDRISGDVIDTWRAGGGNSPGSSTISNNNVYSLHRDSGGSIWVGTAAGADKWDGSSWSRIQPHTGWGWGPTDFYDLTSDSSYLYAGTNYGACQYRLSDLGREDCWNYYSTPEGLPSSYVYSVATLSNGLLYAGTNYGAGVIDTVNDTVVDVWTAGEETWNGPLYEYDNIVYIGFNGAGIARYDRINDAWLTAWDSSNTNSPQDDNDVTTLIPDRQAHRIWVGGDFGLHLIDLDNATLEEDFSRSSGQNSAGELVIIGNILYWSEERSGTQSNDDIYRYDIDNMTQISSIDAGQRISQSGLVYGIGEGPDGMLWIGVSPSGWQSGLYAGSVVRWDHANDTWGGTLDETGTILRVNSVYAGECEPLNISACHIFASYGEKVHRHFDYHGNLLNEWDDSDLQGPIRSIDLYQGLIHFATYDGIARYDMYNDTWASTLTSGNGLPSNSEDTIYDIEIVGDDLWYSTMDPNGWSSWNRNSKIFRYNGTTQQWSDWSAGSNNIPQGFGFSMEVCNDIMHVAMARVSSQGGGSQGGVARYNLSSGQWMSQWTQGSQQQRGLDDDDAVALACDEIADVVYVGFEENDVGISRYSYNTGNWLSSLSETSNGILPDQVFPDGMRWHDGVLMISHTSDGGGIGGISRIAANGGQLGSGIQLDVGTQASSMEIVPSQGNQVDWLIGRPGGDSGYNRVDIINSTGLHKGAVDILAGLSSGRMLDVTFQGTDVWATFASDSSQYYGSSILHGELQSNGTIVWIDAYSFVWDVVNEMLPVNNDLWVTTYSGLFSVDIATGQISGTPVALHNQMHGISKHGGDLVIGLMGTSTSSAGFQVFNLTTNTWTDGSLIAGLPSNIVRDFVEYDNRIWIATFSGIGVWNLTSQSWDDSITTQNGLSSTFVEQIWEDNGELMLATPSGLVRWDVANETVVATYDRSSGLIGNRVNSIAYSPSAAIINGNSTILYGPTLFLSHNGDGASRPGATEFDLSSMQATQQYQVDMLPSNDVRSVAGDWWGVHVATTEEPLMHWNAGSNQMESGSPSWSFQSWPIRDLVSDGTTLLAISMAGVDWVDISGSQHGIYHQENIFPLTGAWVGANGVWLTTLDDGLFGFGPSPNYLEVERESMRRADPLSATFSGTSWDITNSTKPGYQISLINYSNPVTTPAQANSASPLGIPIHQMPLTLSSPVSGAAVWLSSHYLNYTGVWNLTELNSNLDQDFTLAARRGALAHGGRDLHIRLQSPLNGSLEVRIKYNWSRSESPVEMLDLYDRPDDGGGVLIAEWTPSQDHGWAAYL